MKIYQIVLVMLLGVGLYYAGGYFNKTIEYQKQDVVVEIHVKAKILEKIAKCESGGSQYDRNGQVQFNGNKDGSVDIGKFQINNKLWGKKATELGYNLTIEKDNEAMAQWIYENRGTEDWVWSKKCWNK